MKTYEFFKLSLIDFLNILQQKTKENANNMQEIYNYTIDIKKNEADTEERKFKLKNALMMNNEFISKNKKYMDVHNSIMQILMEWEKSDEFISIKANNQQWNELKNHDEIPQTSKEDNSVILLKHHDEETKNELNLDNPALHDKEFVAQLMEKYLEEEAYEKCGELQKIIDLNNFCKN